MVISIVNIVSANPPINTIPGYIAELAKARVPTSIETLNKTDYLGKNVTLIDQHGDEIVLSIDQMEFLIQRRALVGFKRLDDLLSNQKKEAALESIVSLMTVVARRIEKGFIDKDLQFYKNFGFLDDSAIEIDIGEIRESPAPRSLEDIRNEMTGVSVQLTEWIADHYPEYTPDVDRTIRDVINQVQELEN